jgi:hypothetical protein
MKQPTDQQERNEDKKKPEKENPSHGIDPESKEPELEVDQAPESARRKTKTRRRTIRWRPEPTGTLAGRQFQAPKLRRALILCATYVLAPALLLSPGRVRPSVCPAPREWRLGRELHTFAQGLNDLFA